MIILLVYSDGKIPAAAVKLTPFDSVSTLKTEYLLTNQVYHRN